MKPESQTRGVFSDGVSIFRFVRPWQSDKDEGNYTISRGVRTCRGLTQVITGDF